MLVLAAFFDTESKATNSLTLHRNFQVLALIDGVLNDRLIVHHCINITSRKAIIHQVTCVKGFESEAVLILVLLKETLGSCTGFDTDFLPFQLFIFADGVCLGRRDNDLGVVVGIRHGKDFFALACLGHTSHDSVRLAGLDRIDGCIEAWEAHVNVPAFDFCDLVDDINVNPLVSLIRIFKFKWCVSSIGYDFDRICLGCRP